MAISSIFSQQASLRLAGKVNIFALDDKKNIKWTNVIKRVIFILI